MKEFRCTRKHVTVKSFWNYINKQALKRDIDLERFISFNDFVNPIQNFNEENIVIKPYFIKFYNENCTVIITFDKFESKGESIGYCYVKDKL